MQIRIPPSRRTKRSGCRSFESRTMQCVYPAPCPSRDLAVAPYILINHLEHVSIDWLAKEEALEWRRTKRREQLRAFRREAPFERVELCEGIEDRDVSPELVFKRRHAEPVDKEHV